MTASTVNTDLLDGTPPAGDTRDMLSLLSVLALAINNHGPLIDAATAGTASTSEVLDGTTGKIIANLAVGTSILAFAGAKAFTLPNGTVAGQKHTFYAF